MYVCLLMKRGNICWRNQESASNRDQRRDAIKAGLSLPWFRLRHLKEGLDTTFKLLLLITHLHPVMVSDCNLP